MSNVKLCLSLLLVLTVVSCQTPTASDIARFNGRPTFAPPCISNGDGTCYRDGELEDNLNNLCGSGGEFDQVQDWIEFLEEWRYKCIKFGRCK